MTTLLIVTGAWCTTSGLLLVGLSRLGRAGARADGEAWAAAAALRSGSAIRP